MGDDRGRSGGQGHQPDRGVPGGELRTVFHKCISRTWWMAMLAVSATGCWLAAPERISEMDGVAIDVELYEWATHATLGYDANALLGCAELRHGFGGSLNGVAQDSMYDGGRATFDSCRSPVLSFLSPQASEYRLRIFDSSATLEMDVTNPWEATAKVVRCVGAKRCSFSGPLASSSM